MTPEQRLAIAEELVVISANARASFLLDDLEVYDSGGAWVAIRKMSNPDGIVRGASKDIIEAIYIARQKLAAEKEKSPRE